LNRDWIQLHLPYIDKQKNSKKKNAIMASINIDSLFAD